MAIAWEPPARTTTSFVVAVDPPAGWCIWGSTGIIAAGQHDDILVAVADYRKARRETTGGRYAWMSVVERPYGGKKDIQALVHNAIAGGWWMRELQYHTAMMWNPRPDSWRKHIGMSGLDRNGAKRAAIMVANEIGDLMHVQQLGDKEHAAEAVCMALSAWLRYGMVVQDDAAHRFIKHTGMPYEGGNPPEFSARIELTPGYTVQKRRTAPTKKRKPLPVAEEDYASPFDGATDQGEQEPWRPGYGRTTPGPRGAEDGHVRGDGAEDGDSPDRDPPG